MSLALSRASAFWGQRVSKEINSLEQDPHVKAYPIATVIIPAAQLVVYLGASHVGLVLFSMFWTYVEASDFRHRWV